LLLNEITLGDSPRRAIEGLTSERVCISQRTVHRHVANILTKRNASS